MGWLRSLMRRRVRARSFPERWRAILEDRAPFVRRIPQGRRPKFEADLMVFEKEKTIIGAGGLEVGEEVRVVISACAVRLVLYLDDMQWADAETLLLLQDVLRSPDPPPVLLLMCASRMKWQPG